MSASWCQTCNREYPGEDFCPQHGSSLAVAPVRDVSPTDTDQDSGALDSAVDAEPPTRAEKLAAFFKKFNLRDAKENGAEPAGTPTESRLPAELEQDGWKITGVVSSHGGIDSWPVARLQPDGEQRGLFRLYRTGSLTTNECHRRLQGLEQDLLPKVLAFGTLDLSGGSRADYDLVRLQEQRGTYLHEWFASTTPSEDRATLLLGSLVALLTALDAAGLQAIVLEPAHLLMTSDQRLVLIATGALATQQQAGQPVPHRPEFQRSALLAQQWAAPELLERSQLSPNATVYCCGQLLMQAVFNQPYALADIKTGNVHFQAIADQRLARIAMGCLFPRHDGRWTSAQLQAALHCPLDALPAVAAWSSLAPGASATAVDFAGQSWWRLEDLVEVAIEPRHWSEAQARISDILDWARGTSWQGLAEVLQQDAAKGRSADYILLRLLRTVRPDLPVTWQELDFSPAGINNSLVALAQAGLGRDSDAMETMDKLFKANLQGVLDN